MPQSSADGHDKPVHFSQFLGSLLFDEDPDFDTEDPRFCCIYEDDGRSLESCCFWKTISAILPDCSSYLAAHLSDKVDNGCELSLNTVRECIFDLFKYEKCFDFIIDHRDENSELLINEYLVYKITSVLLKIRFHMNSQKMRILQIKTLVLKELKNAFEDIKRMKCAFVVHIVNIYCRNFPLQSNKLVEIMQKYVGRDEKGEVFELQIQKNPNALREAISVLKTSGLPKDALSRFSGVEEVISRFIDKLSLTPGIAGISICKKLL